MNFFFSFDWKAVSSIVVKVSSFSALLDLNVWNHLLSFHLVEICSSVWSYELFIDIVVTSTWVLGIVL